MPDRTLILASRSPQRVKLMADAGYTFQTEPADIDEEAYPPDIGPLQVARWLALEKARAVAARHPEALVLGADTVVALGAQMLGKPDDADHAARMLRTMSGTVQEVITGVSLVCAREAFERTGHAISLVHMRELSDDDIARYVATGAWHGKAGGYGIQDDDPFVTCTEGSVSNVIGLPMELIPTLLAEYER